MKIFARRIEAPRPDAPYATKWAVAVKMVPDGGTVFYDSVTIDGLATFRTSEASNPAIWVEPGPSAHVWAWTEGETTGTRLQ